jgi:glycosyltransferase involved in cell wall biosynthesis
MRIALTHAHSWPEVRRGGERYLHELGGALARRGHSVTIFAGAARSSTQRQDGVRVVRIARGDAADPGAEKRFALRVWPRLLMGKFDVVHSLGPLDAVSSLRAHLVHPRRRTVYTNLGNPLREWWETLPTRAAHERVVREIDVYGCLSQHSLKCLRSDYGRAGALTPGGVRLSSFWPVAPKQGAPTLLYSGALDVSGKSLDIMFEALVHVARVVPDVRLWLSGSGDPSTVLHAAPRTARARTEVLPLGDPDDQPARYSGAWVTVLPSVHEAFGLALVESLACGTPIVASDDAGAAELVTPRLGALAPPRDAQALAEACVRAIEIARDPASKGRCVQAALAHDWDTAVAPAIEQLYLATRERDGARSVRLAGDGH